MDGHMAEPDERNRGTQSEEDMFRFMVENSGDILWTIDLTGKWQFITSNVEKVAHLKVKDVLRRTVWDFVAPEYIEILKDKLKRRMAGEDIPAYEVMVIDGYGRRVPFEVKTSPILDKEGKTIGIQGISRDITWRKSAEEAVHKAYAELERRVEERTRDLAEARSTLQAILDTAPIGIIVANAPDGRITFNSTGAREMFRGEMREYVSGTKVTYQILHTDGTPYRDNELPLAQSLQSGKHVTGAEMQLAWPGGNKRVVMVSSAPIRDGQDHITAAVAAMVDITRLKSTENELREAKAQAELYLDLMSHDINNMNLMAMGYIEMARDKAATDSEAAMPLEKAADMLISSSQLIDNVRKIQKAEAGELPTETLDLCDIIENVKEKYSSVPGKSVTITATYQVGHGCMVTTNRLIEDVFANLVSNSIKHSTPDQPVIIDITISEIRDHAHREYYQVAVEDNGVGIPDEIKGKLFSRLQRGKTKTAGRGLGLYLSKTLVEDFHGKIWVEDKVAGDYHKGSRFVVLLPAVQEKLRAAKGASTGQ